MTEKTDSAFKIIEKPVIEKIIETAFRLLQKPGLKVYNDRALKLFDDAGAEVDFNSRIVKLPQGLIENSLKTMPSAFTLYDLKGEASVYLEKNKFHPYPGTTAINIYDYEKRQFREAASKDLKNFIKLVEQLPYIPVNSSFVCKDVPENFTDIYRMGLAFKHSKKPIKTSVFTSKDAIPAMINLFAAIAGGSEELKNKPFGFVSVNADPPLMWNDFITEVLIECAKSKIPLSLGSMPISGAAAPITIMGSLIQHTAESLSGITLSQIVQPGAPGLYGSSPIIFDVRKGTTPMGAIETLMFNCGCAQIGKFLDMPTQLYTGLSDAKVLDTQVGFESAMGILLGALSGINLFAVGMLNFETALTMENMVIANEIAGNTYRLMEGIDASEEHFTTDVWEEVGHRQDFLGTMHTIRHFEKEQFCVSEITDRDSETEWQRKGSRDTAERAHNMVQRLLSEEIPKVVDPQVEEEIDDIVIEYAKKLGINRDQIPEGFFAD